MLENEKYIPFMTEKLRAPEEIIKNVTVKKDAKLTNALACKKKQKKKAIAAAQTENSHKLS
jgi:hypothetical protein